ncbi:MAG: nitrogen regulation protein NR(II) [Gammaproteobacteria bacterium]|nr:nitrogen regulation protein NR(II) [Gammaproteobacteria bacterium]MDH3450748.1 nitrogen regulation protein NR(II) [Gammaproteobacteria bacterium]
MQHSNAIPEPLADLGIRILDTLETTLLCLDAERRITYINATGEALFEHSASSLVGRHFDSLLSRIEPSTISAKLALAPRPMTEHAAVITLANGNVIVADYSIYPFGENSPEAEILLEIRQLERQAQIAREEFNQLQQQASQQLARGLAHEINNPLGGIRGAAQLLQRELDRPEWLEYTEVIISEVDRLQTLIRNMLGPGTKLQRRLINIYEVLEHICKIVHAAEPKRIQIHRDYDPSIPPLMADRDLLIQAFLNLARNAVQAIDDRGEITVKTRIDRNYTIGQTTHPLVVQIDITDSGRGISRELSETIFLPMITDKPEGNGLGLPIAQEIISRHGGKIFLRSSAAGSTFSTILPLER